MKCFVRSECFLLFTFSLTLGHVAWAAEQTAFGRLWCESLRFSQGQYSGQTMDLSTVLGTINGEFGYYDGVSLFTAFTINSSGAPISGAMIVELPPYWDINDNGFDDFYESSLSVSGSSMGTFETSVSTGTVTAAWSRPAGSKNGTCVLKMVDETYGALGDFNHTFELLEFTGPVFYTPAPTNMTAQAAFEQTGNTTNKFGGPWLLTKESTNRFNMIHVAEGTWTNTVYGPLSFPSTTFYRDVEWPTNYYGYFDLVDGYPATSEYDYNYWTISIDDLNDSNSNGIPDFSDDPLPRPQLTLQLGVNEVLLSISGTPGRTHEIQQSPTLLPGSWQVVRTVQVTNDPQVVSFPLTEQNAYWRALLK